MIYCKELNKEFSTKAEMFKALRESHKGIIADKCARVYNSKKGEHKGAVDVRPIDFNKLNTEIKGLKIDSDYYYIAVNTTRILDSHKDVSIDKSWDKTAKDQQGKVYLIFNHDFDPTKVIAYKEDIEMFVVKIPFSLLGKSYSGETEALIYKIKKTNVISQLAKDWLDSGKAIEASVRLQYVQILFAMNSDEDEDKEFKKNYNKYYPIIANKDDFKEIDYFWAVIQQINRLESSLVLAGSNHVTGQIEEDNKSIDIPQGKTMEEYKEMMGSLQDTIMQLEQEQKPPEGTSKHTEPPEGTQTKSVLINLLNQ